MRAARGQGGRVAAGRGGFTIIELLVVVLIISVLATIVLTMGVGIARSGRERLTRDTIRVLDNALDTYIRENGGQGPPRLVEVPHPQANRAAGGETVLVPFIDGIDATDMPGGSERNKYLINTAGLFVQAAEQIGVGSAIDDVPEGSLGQFDPDEQTGMNRQPSLTTVLDAWGRPIRAVHPAFDGVLTNGSLGATYAPDNIAPVPLLDNGPVPNLGLPAALGVNPPLLEMRQVRRAYFTDAVRQANAGRPVENAPGDVPNPFLNLPEPGDSDGGSSPNGRMYFYSAGANEDPSDLETNIYTTEPRRPQID